MMKKLGVKTSRYANTELYTYNPINEKGEGTIDIEGLKYSFKVGHQFWKVDVPRSWTNPTGKYEKWVAPLLTEEARLTTWEDIEAYYKTCIVTGDEDEEFWPDEPDEPRPADYVPLDTL